jgi:membrane associated rhomboid family serine protease
MIPLRDVIPSRTAPLATVGLIVANALVFAFQLTLPEEDLRLFVQLYGVVPAALDPLTLVTSMFLHGGWLHFLGNMLYLWIFGDNVEDRVGHGRFLAFYLLCGVAAALAQVAVNPGSRVPMVGASGAIAGVMGAYFVLFPHSRILTLVPFFFYWELVEVPAVLFLGFWFVLQFLSGVGSLAPMTAEDVGGIAFWAHVAGFAVGAGLIRFLRRPERRRVEWWDLY